MHLCSLALSRQSFALLLQLPHKLLQAETIMVTKVTMVTLVILGTMVKIVPPLFMFANQLFQAQTNCK